MKKIVIVSALLLSVIAQAEDKAAGTKVSYVRIERIVGQPNEGALEWRDRVKELQTDLENRSAKLASEYQAVEKEKAELQSPEKSKWMSLDMREEKAKKLMSRENEIKTEAAYLEQYKNRQAQALQQDMLQKIEKVTDEIRTKRGDDLVFVGGAISVDKRVDITDEVLAGLNKDYAAAKAKKAADAKAAATAKPAPAPAKK